MSPGAATMRSITSFCSMKCWSCDVRRQRRAGGTGSAWRCCRAGCRPRAVAGTGQRRASAAKSTFSTSDSITVELRRARAAAAARSRSSSITRQRAAALAPAAASARPGPGPISTIASPGCGSIASHDRVDDAAVGQEVLAEALARDVLARPRRRLTAAARATRRRRARALPCAQSRRPRSNFFSRSTLRACSRCSLRLERGLAALEHLDQVHAEARHHRLRRCRPAPAGSSPPRTRARSAPGATQPRSPPCAAQPSSEYSRASVLEVGGAALDLALELGQRARAATSALSCADGRSRMWRARVCVTRTPALSLPLDHLEHVEAGAGAQQRRRHLAGLQRRAPLRRRGRAGATAGRRPITPPFAAVAVVGHLARHRGEVLAAADARPARASARALRCACDWRIGALGHRDQDLRDVRVRRPWP